MFNQESRTKNVIRISTISSICSVFKLLVEFIYRSIFLTILSSNYLGISGLFNNILQILSFVDLGIGNAVTYRFYEPVSKHDTQKIGQLLSFFKNAYCIISFVILIIGISFYPFLGCFIKDTSEIPIDVDLHVVYILFLCQTISTYWYTYKQTILSVDQKEYVTSFVQTIICLLRILMQIIVLSVSHNYILTLASGIALTFLMNIFFCKWIENEYKEVFCVKESISKEESDLIYKDTKATLFHKIGGTVLNNTDNIVISKYIGINATGIFSNYNLILSNLITFLTQALGNFSSSIGNSRFSQNTKQKYNNYKRLLFLNLWISSIFTICIYNLINDFICIWVGENMLLTSYDIPVLCVQFFLETTRIISTSYTNACGLFVKDKIRPLIETGINLSISIALTRKIGITGVFLGTILSQLFTVSWREPYLLYKYEFKVAYEEYWILYIKFSLLSIFLSFLFSCLFKILNFVVLNFALWILKGIMLFIFANVLFVLFMHKSSEYRFYFNFVKELMRTLKISINFPKNKKSRFTR